MASDIFTYNYEFRSIDLSGKSLPTVNAFYVNSYGTGLFEPWSSTGAAEAFIKLKTENPTGGGGYVPHYITVLAKDTDGIPYEYQYTSADGEHFEWKKKEGSGGGGGSTPVTIDYIVVVETDRVHIPKLPNGNITKAALEAASKGKVYVVTKKDTELSPEAIKVEFSYRNSFKDVPFKAVLKKEEGSNKFSYYYTFDTDLVQDADYVQLEDSFVFAEFVLDVTGSYPMNALQSIIIDNALYSYKINTRGHYYIPTGGPTSDLIFDVDAIGSTGDPIDALPKYVNLYYQDEGKNLEGIEITRNGNIYTADENNLKSLFDDGKLLTGTNFKIVVSDDNNVSTTEWIPILRQSDFNVIVEPTYIADIQPEARVLPAGFKNVEIDGIVLRTLSTITVTKKGTSIPFKITKFEIEGALAIIYAYNEDKTIEETSELTSVYTPNYEVNAFAFKKLTEDGFIRVSLTGLSDYSDFKGEVSLSFAFIRGEEGPQGYSSFTSFVFKRSTDPITKAPDGTAPNDGSYNTYENPHPNPIDGWSDGIPAITAETQGPVYMTKRVFSTDPGFGSPTWSVPEIMIDSETLDIEWHGKTTDGQMPAAPGWTDPTHTEGKDNGWYDEISDMTEEPYYMAMCVITNKVYEKNKDGNPNWQISKIKGERGDDGKSVHLAGKYDTLQEFIDAHGTTNPEQAWIAPESEDDAYIVMSNPGVTSFAGSTFTTWDSTMGSHLIIWDGDSWEDSGKFGGEDGESNYIHLKYANQTTQGTKDSFEITDPDDSTKTIYLILTAGDGEDPGEFIGTWTDTNPNDDDIDPKTIKWRRWKGEDGFGYEYIYLLSNSATAPNVPTGGKAKWQGGEGDWTDDTYQNNDFVPDGWFDNPPTATASEPYVWACYRKKENGKWSPFRGTNNLLNQAYLYVHYGSDYSGYSFTVSPENQFIIDPSIESGINVPANNRQIDFIVTKYDNKLNERVNLEGNLHIKIYHNNDQLQNNWQSDSYEIPNDKHFDVDDKLIFELYNGDEFWERHDIVATKGNDLIRFSNSSITLDDNLSEESVKALSTTTVSYEGNDNITMRLRLSDPDIQGLEFYNSNNEKITFPATIGGTSFTYYIKYTESTVAKLSFKIIADYCFGNSELWSQEYYQNVHIMNIGDGLSYKLVVSPEIVPTTAEGTVTESTNIRIQALKLTTNQSPKQVLGTNEVTLFINDSAITSGFSNNTYTHTILKGSTTLPVISLRIKDGENWIEVDNQTLKANRRAYLPNNYQFSDIIYKDSATNPGVPSMEGVSYDFSNNTLSGLKDDWKTDCPDDPDYDIYMSTVTISVSYDDNLTKKATLSASAPVKMTGKDGEAGKDGDGLKFIYQRATALPSTPPTIPPGTTYPTIPTDWYDSPQGVDLDNPKEYMSETHYADGTWSNWSTPVLWSYYGHDGTDGDGIEYMYLLVKEILPDTGWTTYWLNEIKTKNGNKDWDNKTSTYQMYSEVAERMLLAYYDDDTKNTYYWKDNPQSISSEYPYQYVAIRKYSGESLLWGLPTAPTLWNFMPNDMHIEITPDLIVFDDLTDGASVEYKSATKIWIYDGNEDITSLIHSSETSTSKKVEIKFNDESSNFEHSDLTYNTTENCYEYHLTVKKSITNLTQEYDNILIKASYENKVVLKTLIINTTNISADGTSYQLIVSPNVIDVDYERTLLEDAIIKVLLNRIVNGNPEGGVFRGDDPSLPAHVFWYMWTKGIQIYKEKYKIEVPLLFTDEQEDSGLLSYKIAANTSLPLNLNITLYKEVDNEWIVVAAESIGTAKAGKDANPYRIELDNDMIVIDDNSVGATIEMASKTTATLYYEGNPVSGNITYSARWTETTEATYCNLKINELDEWNNKFYLTKSGRIGPLDEFTSRVCYEASINGDVVARRYQQVSVDNISAGEVYSLVVIPNTIEVLNQGGLQEKEIEIQLWMIPGEVNEETDERADTTDISYKLNDKSDNAEYQLFVRTDTGGERRVYLDDLSTITESWFTKGGLIFFVKKNGKVIDSETVGLAVQGADGDLGNDGLTGAVVRYRGKWEDLNKEPRTYYDGKTLDESDIMYLDIIYYNGLYKRCAFTHDVQLGLSFDREDSSYWQNADYKGFVATDLIFAELGEIKFGSSNLIALLNNDGEVTGGAKGANNSDDIVFWAGGSTPSDSKFKVTAGGTVTATGNINATTFNWMQGNLIVAGLALNTNLSIASDLPRDIPLFVVYNENMEIIGYSQIIMKGGRRGETFYNVSTLTNTTITAQYLYENDLKSNTSVFLSELTNQYYSGYRGDTDTLYYDEDTHLYYDAYEGGQLANGSYLVNNPNTIWFNKISLLTEYRIYCSESSGILGVTFTNGVKQNTLIFIEGFIPIPGGPNDPVVPNE